MPKMQYPDTGKVWINYNVLIFVKEKMRIRIKDVAAPEESIRTSRGDADLTSTKD